MTLSPRAHKVLTAILLLPEGKDGWRRAAYRDQLHEGVPGLSRGAVARSLGSGELEGLVVVQGIGQSARLAQGYKVTARGESLAREAGSIQPDPVTRSSTDPVFDSGLISPSIKEKENQEPTTERRGRATKELDRSSPDPVAGTFELGPRSLAVLYAAQTQTPLCGCLLPMHPKDGKRGWFWACMYGRKGCGLTAPMRYQPKGAASARGVRTITDDEAKRRGDFSALTGSAWRALNAASRGTA